MNSSGRQNAKSFTQTLTLYSRKVGENGPDFVVLHGLFGSGKNWRSFAGSLEEDFQVWTLDARNHGDSPHADSMSYQQMAEDVVRFFDENELENVILLGHSMGGKTAMQLALQFPDRIAALIVVDIAPVCYDHQQKQLKLIEAMQGLHLAAEMSRSDIEKKLALKIPEKRLLSFLMTNLYRQNGQFQWRIGLEQIAAGMPYLLNYPELNSVFKGPVQFIGGENSAYLKFEYHALIRKKFPESRITMLKNCGHWLHVEQPAAFQKTVNEFLRYNNLR
ncbi:MAG: alpha/beta fold hydrolase [SAR324 cluster bacterium]|jgi:pimeloyl-ACP methyl ester carboxylesterase|uniref:AB hydrolase-1 domain-containing protein n=1 Tax=marine metagenome TaxID=408172 RepID=A0A381PTU7_9ZZZZ|nr:alpha/beta hydrolase [Deltaproteobacteria bacterium]MDP6307924.1 alpha/beta fold hydrolase [SAR324 cluster bacterium]MDP7170221.1 alpha/beta fold hydrolase [SAR324 cluster bacterium]MDP7438838.1 alpha/beta fold hydrolase [SAR324 cluster bacterium]HBR58969.1 alpha/beta hydrolase [Deltaproteobacteria bacterium]|tara:strand:- start:350 stop:1177 length:828 start_codon:yes stop_codon:yes gene_type:complete